MRGVSGKLWLVAIEPAQTVQALRRKVDDLLQAKTRLLLRVW